MELAESLLAWLHGWTDARGLAVFVAATVRGNVVPGQ
ncbi:hypothetical protein B0I31_107223 [Saccharothrix carnea]|uniref:Uncharacterized protein n=1 Tax=Saccharothrix carnea TaxID=1280637 RepID=A0A2P8I6W7_SACCR|nr:hypothetical protein B0I31_107223 [Saccharothrix carnea]